MDATVPIQTASRADVESSLQALLRPPGFDSLSLWGYYSFIWSEELTFDAADQEVRAPIGDLADHKAWLGGTARTGRVTSTHNQLAAAFAHEARKLDEGAGKLASPKGGRVRLANFLQRKADHRPTVH